MAAPHESTEGKCGPPAYIEWKRETIMACLRQSYAFGCSAMVREATTVALALVIAFLLTLFASRPAQAQTAPTKGQNRESSLTDAQIQEAIERGIHDKSGSGCHRSGCGQDIVEQAKHIRVSAGIWLTILSDSDRIALAASSASHELDKKGRRIPKQNFSFSVEDARATAVRFGVVYFVGSIDTPKVKKGASSSHAEGAKLMLEVDGESVQPMTNAQYVAGAPQDSSPPILTKSEAIVVPSTDGGLPTPPILTKSGATVVPSTDRGLFKQWPVSDYVTIYCDMDCASLGAIFPVIEGAHQVSVIVFDAAGHRVTKELDPRVLEER